MKAMILAAGLGKRMRPLTDEIPKPLLTVHQKPLILYHLEKMASVGIKEVVININLSHFGDKLETTLGNGHSLGINIIYSKEMQLLETGGAIVQALPFLGKDPFLVVSGDILTDYPFEQLPKSPTGLAHLVLVDNPPYHVKGDYGLVDPFVTVNTKPLFNFAGIGVYRSELFVNAPKGAFRLPELFNIPLRNNEITGEHYQGFWRNIGTIEDLEEAELNYKRVSSYHL